MLLCVGLANDAIRDESMNPMPVLTLITASYNRADVLRTALDSVLRQSFTDFEYWVVDGGSTDGTPAILREHEMKFGGRLRWISEPDCGMYDAINKGIRRATGKIVGILNADDVLASDDVMEKVAREFGSSGALSRAAKPGTKRREFFFDRITGFGGSSSILCKDKRTTLSQGPLFYNEERVDVVYGDIRFIRDRRDAGLDALRAEATVRYYSARHWRPWMLRWGFMPPHPSVYIRRECFERLGDYALDYEIAADYALLVRFLRKARLTAAYLPACMVDMRLGGRSTRNWRSNLQLNREIVRGNREAGYCCCLPMLAPKYLFKIWEFIVPKFGRLLAGSRS